MITDVVAVGLRVGCCFLERMRCSAREWRESWRIERTEGESKGGESSRGIRKI